MQGFFQVSRSKLNLFSRSEGTLKKTDHNLQIWAHSQTSLWNIKEVLKDADNYAKFEEDKLKARWDIRHLLHHMILLLVHVPYPHCIHWYVSNRFMVFLLVVRKWVIVVQPTADDRYGIYIPTDATQWKLSQISTNFQDLKKITCQPPMILMCLIDIFYEQAIFLVFVTDIAFILDREHV